MAEWDWKKTKNAILIQKTFAWEWKKKHTGYAQKGTNGLLPLVTELGGTNCPYCS